MREWPIGQSSGSVLCKRAAQDHAQTACSPPSPATVPTSCCELRALFHWDHCLQVCFRLAGRREGITGSTQRQHRVRLAAFSSSWHQVCCGRER